MPSASHLLKEIFLDEVSLVYRPAAQFAQTVLCKSNDGLNRHFKIRTNGGIQNMTPEELAKALEAREAEVEELTKRVEKAEAESKTAADQIETLTKSAEEAGLTIKKAENGDIAFEKAAGPEFITVNGERVEKSAVPAPILKQLEDNAARIEKMEKAAEEERFSKAAEDLFPNLAGEADVKGRLLKAIDGLSDEDAKAVKTALKAADAAVSKMFEEVGKAGALDPDAPEAKLDELVKSYAKENKVSSEIAFDEVTKSGAGREFLLATRANKH